MLGKTELPVLECGDRFAIDRPPHGVVGRDVKSALAHSYPNGPNAHATERQRTQSRA